MTDLQEPHARVTFSVVPTCHAVSPITASPDRLDIVVGFVTGDIVWLDIIAGKYSRINKGVGITFAPYTMSWTGSSSASLGQLLC